MSSIAKRSRGIIHYRSKEESRICSSKDSRKVVQVISSHRAAKKMSTRSLTKQSKVVKGHDCGWLPRGYFRRGPRFERRQRSVPGNYDNPSYPFLKFKPRISCSRCSCFEASACLDLLRPNEALFRMTTIQNEFCNWSEARNPQTDPK
jgi:hypothetical protein